MRNLILILSIILSTVVFSATENTFLDFGNKNFASTKMDASKWVFNLGFEFVEFKTQFIEYNGAYEDIDLEPNSIFGLNYGMGREFYFGAGISSTVLVNAFYIKTGDMRIGQATKEIDLELSSLRRTAAMYGGDISVSLNYLADYKDVDIQPFIAIAAGMGTIESERTYFNEGLSSGATNEENYDMRVTESFIHSKLALGLNIISSYGITSYFKATAIRLAKTNRKTVGSIKPLGTTTFTKYDQDEKISESDTVISLALGMGYMF